MYFQLRTLAESFRALTPLFLFFTALALGSLWLARPVTRDIGRIVKPAAPEPPKEFSPSPPVTLQSARDAADLSIKLGRAQTNLSTELSNVEALKTNVAALEDQIVKLRAELQELQRKSTDLNMPQTDQSATIHGLEAAVRGRQEELANLHQRLEAIKPIPQKSEFALRRIVRAVEPVNKLPVLVELYQNHITPVTKEYFHFPMFSLKNVFVVKRSKLGETIVKAESPTSNFVRFLANITPDEYVSCLLNADSFQAFYAARDMARKREIEIGWDPADTGDGAIKIVNVALGKESDKNKIAVPQVVR